MKKLTCILLKIYKTFIYFIKYLTIDTDVNKFLLKKYTLYYIQ